MTKAWPRRLACLPRGSAVTPKRRFDQYVLSPAIPFRPPYQLARRTLRFAAVRLRAWVLAPPRRADVRRSVAASPRALRRRASIRLITLLGFGSATVGGSLP